MLTLVSGQGEALTPAHFHEVFLLMAVLALLALPALLRLRVQNGWQVSGHARAVG